MKNTEIEKNTQKQKVTELLKDWMTLILILVFVGFYITSFLGWIKPLNDLSIITRLEALIFVIIGYYFGRMPSKQNEKLLKSEINRQIQRADAAQHTKEKTLQERARLEEKVKNAEDALLALNISGKSKMFKTDELDLSEIETKKILNNSVNMTLEILRS